ncbi:MAG: hypothetical protein WD766_13560 [Gemmatimonadota bacterium]
MKLMTRVARQALALSVALVLFSGPAAGQRADDTGVRPPTGRAFASTVVEPPGSLPQPQSPRTPRLPPLAESEWTEEQRAAYQRNRGEGVSENVLRTLIRVPALADRVIPFVKYLASESSIPARHRGILILRTAWLTRSQSLWSTYASRSEAMGLTAAEVRRVAEGPASGWSGFEGTLMSLADELFRNSSVTDRTWAALDGEYDLSNLVDAVATVNQTTYHAILFNALGIQPDPNSTARLPLDEVEYVISVPERERPLAEPRVEPVEGTGLRVSRTFARHPRVSELGAGSPYVLSPELSRLTPHDRELLILRTGWNARSVYEWAQHVGRVGRAREHGLEPLWIAQGKDAPGWSENERNLIQAADEMFRESTMSDETWNRLAQTYDTHQMMSVVATVGRYRMVSMTLNALGVQLETGDEVFPVLEGL